MENYKTRFVGYNKKIIQQLDKLKKYQIFYINRNNGNLKKSILTDIKNYLNKETCICTLYTTFQQKIQKIIDDKKQQEIQEQIEVEEQLLNVIKQARTQISESFEDIKKVRRDSGFSED